MYVVNLTKADRLFLKQQQVINDAYVAPRRNKAFSTLFHSNSNVIFVANNQIGLIEDPPRTAMPYGVVPTGSTVPIYWDGTNSSGNLLNRQVVTNVVPTPATVTVQNDVLLISNQNIVQAVEVTKENIPLAVIDNNE